MGAVGGGAGSRWILHPGEGKGQVPPTCLLGGWGGWDVSRTALRQGKVRRAEKTLLGSHPLPRPPQPWTSWVVRSIRRRTGVTPGGGLGQPLDPSPPASAACRAEEVPPRNGHWGRDRSYLYLVCSTCAVSKQSASEPALESKSGPPAQLLDPPEAGVSPGFLAGAWVALFLRSLNT